MNNKHAIHKQLTTHYSLLTNFAFTLAETLIVMGIIGVVAALTLPNLNSSTGDKEKVVKVKKIYQNLTDAFGRAQAVYGPHAEWPQFPSTQDKNTKFIERITEFMKVSKTCATNSGSGCCTNELIKYLDGDDANDSVCPSDGGAFILADGTLVGVYIGGPIGDLYVDIDGPNKGSNTFGKDVFVFRVNNSEIYPYGYDITTDNMLKINCFNNGDHCTNWVIQNENMDYLKCPDKLSITNTSCK